jgi:hypothetical protein
MQIAAAVLLWLGVGDRTSDFRSNGRLLDNFLKMLEINI